MAVLYSNQPFCSHDLIIYHQNIRKAGDRSNNLESSVSTFMEKLEASNGLNGITNNYVLPLLNLPYLLTMWSMCWYILTRYTIYIILVYRTSHHTRQYVLYQEHTTTYYINNLTNQSKLQYTYTRGVDLKKWLHQTWLRFPWREHHH